MTPPPHASQENTIVLQPGVVALVAEDETLTRMEAADMLGDAGFKVFEAGTAQQALDCLEAHPEVVLLMTDIRMPGPLDGLALAHQVHGRWPQMRIILVSGYAPPSPNELPHTARFIEKPYLAAQIARVLHEVGILGATS